MLSFAFHITRKLHYKLFLAPKGYGEPVSPKLLDQQYKEGFWDFLDSIDEMANYIVTVGYVRHFAKKSGAAPRLLDIGCGDGNLAEMLSAYPWKSYLGVDISAEAVKKAETRGFPDAEFQVVDFENWKPAEKFDFIISTGSICYATDPVRVLKNYAAALTENGAFVISLWRHGHNSAIWKKIEENFEIIDSTVVTNHKGLQWDVKVLR